MPVTRAAGGAVRLDDNEDDEVYSQDNFMESPEIMANRKAEANTIE